MVAVSVIVPAYNDQKGVDACLAALASQTYPRGQYEVIVVDNGSHPAITVGPSFRDIARVVICHKPGSYAARNVGVAAARGRVLALTDADCVPESQWLSHGLAALTLYEWRSVIGGEVELTLSQRPTAVELYQCLAGFAQRENIERVGFTVTANLFVTRDLFERVGPFNEELLSGGDLEWSWRANRAGVSLHYAADAIVRTAPRRSLAAAIRQTRRVAGGRYALRRLGAVHVPPAKVKPRQSVLSAAKWILTHPDLTLRRSIAVFSVASFLKAVQVLESARLALGLNAERR